MKTRVYVDGFNLYYGALRGTKHKWLDLAELLRQLLPKNQIDHICYCTARVSSRSNNPGQPMRQSTYLRALRTLPNLTIVEGAFIAKPVRMHLVEPTQGQRFATVLRTEGKRHVHRRPSL